MTWTALVLVLISAVAHAGWNFYGKKSSPTIAFFFLVTLFGFLLFAPILFAHTQLIAAFDARILLLLLATGLFQAVYLSALAAAYQAGDMSIAYPIARSSPLIIVCLTAFSLGQRDSISAQAIVGVALIVGGCLFIPMTRFSDLRWSNYGNRTTAFALLAALATAGYSIVDDAATSQMRGLLDPISGRPWADPLQVSLVYVTLQCLSAALWMSLLIAVVSKERERLKPLLRHSLMRCAGTGAFMTGAYALVILAMAFASNVSYVVAFRQVSIPLGVLMAVVGFKEKLYPPKVAGVFTTVCGLVAVALG
ncbi:EamA family transporter [Hahella sp. NBU794]|uniref:EamA family transporter n=1 Tax=Hahella sp. NBU794 TaxID=3422590 RepID=UPI003D6FBBC5